MKAHATNGISTCRRNVRRYTRSYANNQNNIVYSNNNFSENKWRKKCSLNRKRGRINVRSASPIQLTSPLLLLSKLYWNLRRYFKTGKSVGSWRKKIICEYRYCSIGECEEKWFSLMKKLDATKQYSLLVFWRQTRCVPILKLKQSFVHLATSSSDDHLILNIRPGRHSSE